MKNSTTEKVIEHIEWRDDITLDEDQIEVIGENVIQTEDTFYEVHYNEIPDWTFYVYDGDLDVYVKEILLDRDEIVYIK